MDASLIGLIAAALFGAIVGSFLNVVIYRLPLGLSVCNPAWSFCPNCRTRIKPQHNIPIFGWLFLRGECRYCTQRISAMYPIVECACMLMFIAMWDGFFVSRIVPGIGGVADGWPLAIGAIVLMCCLLAGAVMDLEYYIVDIRLCVFAMIVGAVCYGVQGLPLTATPPARAAMHGMLPPGLVAVALVMGALWLATVGIAMFFRRGDAIHEDGNAAESAEADVQRLREEDAAAQADSNAKTDHASTINEGDSAAFKPLPLLLLCIATAVVFGAAVWLPPSATIGGVSLATIKGTVITCILLLVLIMASLIHRDSDEEVIDAIESERVTARSQAASEFCWLLPAFAVGVAVFVLMRYRGWAGLTWIEAAESIGASQAWTWHFLAIAQALAAGTLAAGMGWAVRIIGTMAFGKEAFGTGDIYIMAAIGAAMGFWVMFFAFFLAALLALVGVLATAFAKSSRALPFGPWLALGTLVAFWYQGPLLRFCAPAGSLLWSFLSGVNSWLG